MITQAARPACARRWRPTGSRCTRSRSSCRRRPRPTVSFAAVSRRDTLWVGLRVAGAAATTAARRGRDRSRQRATPSSTARAARTRRPPPRRCRCRPDLTGVLFDSGATWYASLSRRQPLAGGAAAHLERERRARQRARCTRSARGSDGAIWAATSAGLARFDGKNWRPLGTTDAGRRAASPPTAGPGLGRDRQGAARCCRAEARRPPAPIRRRRR